MGERLAPGCSLAGRRVLVTGGLGFIGSALARALVAAGARVTVVDALVPGHGGRRDNLGPAGARCRVQVGDLRDAAVAREAAADQELVFHCAGQSSHVASLRDPARDRELNLDAARSLLAACVDLGTRPRFVLASTRQVYGRARTLPVDETHPVAPLDFNGVHKRLAEEAFEAAGSATTVLRLTNVYGPRQQVGNDEQGFIGILVRRALLGDPLQLFGTGKQIREFAFVDDVVAAMLLAAERDACRGRIFNLGSPDRFALTDFAELLRERTGTPYEVVPFPLEREPIDIGDYYADDSAFRTATGWTPRVRLREGLDRTLRFFRRHPERLRA